MWFCYVAAESLSSKTICFFSLYFSLHIFILSVKEIEIYARSYIDFSFCAALKSTEAQKKNRKSSFLNFYVLSEEKPNHFIILDILFSLFLLSKTTLCSFSLYILWLSSHWEPGDCAYTYCVFTYPFNNRILIFLRNECEFSMVYQRYRHSGRKEVAGK